MNLVKQNVSPAEQKAEENRNAELEALKAYADYLGIMTGNERPEDDPDEPKTNEEEAE